MPANSWATRRARKFVSAWNDEVVLFVKDDGIGIELKHHARVFDLFEKLDKKTEGIGMGLTIVKRIMELYQGRIWIESAGTGE